MERDQIISFLLQACDEKNRQIAELQKLNTELQKQLKQPDVLPVLEKEAI